MGFPLSEGVGRGNTGFWEPKLDAHYVICITTDQVINILHAKWDESQAQKVSPLSLEIDLGHTSGGRNILDRR